MVLLSSLLSFLSPSQPPTIGESVTPTDTQTLILSDAIASSLPSSRSDIAAEAQALKSPRTLKEHTEGTASEWPCKDRERQWKHKKRQ